MLCLKSSSPATLNPFALSVLQLILISSLPLTLLTTSPSQRVIKTEPPHIYVNLRSDWLIQGNFLTLSQLVRLDPDSQGNRSGTSKCNLLQGCQTGSPWRPDASHADYAHPGIAKAKKPIMICHVTSCDVIEFDARDLHR